MMLFKEYIAKQFGYPSGFIGKTLISAFFDTFNAKLLNFALAKVDVQEDDKVLDIGFGPGTLIYKMAKNITTGCVYGIDISMDMVNKACQKNLKFIESKKVELKQGSVEDIPFENDFFDKLCTLNTIYFWPDPEKSIREIHRVLRTDGMLLIGFRIKEQFQNNPYTQTGFNLYTEEDVRSLLEKAGFREVEIIHKKALFVGFCCAIAKK